MAWRYINPGYSRLTTYDYTPSRCKNFVDSAISRTGVAYSNTHYSYNAYQFSVLPENDEYWVKFDFYPTKSSRLYAQETTREYSGIYINFGTTSSSVYYYSRSSTYNLVLNAGTSLTGLKMNSLNTIWLHVKWGDAGTGFLELQINNKRFPKIQDKTFFKQSSFFSVFPTTILGIFPVS